MASNRMRAARLPSDHGLPLFAVVPDADGTQVMGQQQPLVHLSSRRRQQRARRGSR